MSDLQKNRDNLYDILLPEAEKFRNEVIKKKEPFSAINNSKSCRIKFISKKWEKEWQKHCKNNSLPNDATLEY